MKKFEYFEHTADVLFESHGTTIEECVENAALALFNIMGKPKFLKKTVKKKFMVRGENEEEAVVFLLDSLITESDAMQVFWKSFKVEKIISSAKDFAVKGTAFGSEYSPKAAGTHVKAATMHRVKVWKNDKGIWTARIVLDI